MLAHYRILERLGAGGMGVVYKALDTHLNRTVAIKVLPPEAVSDPVRRQRFIQEARAASAIEHPNIVTIYDIAEADGQHFIAMQYVAGQTLRSLAARGGLLLPDGLRYAAQAADALAQAHARGIVHRDLKPENIMVLEQEGRPGQVKILDFGLAKLMEPAESSESVATRSMRLGEELRTEEGTILGTAAYMSPEQAEGKKLDARSDIFSFGSVLYEMVTGRRPFQGETRMATLSAILRQEPEPISERVPGAPPQLEWVIRHCLRKDPSRRFQHMDDVKTALEELKEESESGQLTVISAPPRRRWMPLMVAGGVVVLATVVGLSWWVATRRSSAPQQAQGPVLTRLTSDTGLTTQPAVSPKGDLLAYASDRSGEGNLDIWVQQIGSGQPLRLTRHEADDEEPAFSPDGTRIAFRSGREGGGIYVIPALGGEGRLLVREGRRPRFSPDGTQILYWTGRDFGKIYVVPSTGGAPRPVRPDFYSARNPVWSPDGKYILFHGSKERNELIEAESYDWWVSPVKEGPPVRTSAVPLLRGQGAAPAARIFLPDLWLPETNEVVFSARLGDTTNLWKLAISPASGRVTGAPHRLTFGTGVEVSASAGAPGRLVFASLTNNLDVFGLPIDADQAKLQGELQRWTNDPALDMQASVSADGKRMAFASTRSGNLDVWWKDLASGREAPLTLGSWQEFSPLLSQDGSKVAYVAGDSSKPSIHLVHIGSEAGGGIQSGAPERLCEDCGTPYGWSSDGKKLLYAHWGPPAHVRVIDLTSRQSLELLRHSKHNVWSARFSPDDRWVAFNVQPGGLYVARFQGGPIAATDWTAVTDFGPGSWSPDGQVLYLLPTQDGFRCLWYLRLDPATKKPAGPPQPLYHFHRARLSMMNLEGSPSLSVARDKIVFTLEELTGNIWMAKLEK